MKTTKPKFTLAVSPTFKAPVTIKIPGGQTAEIVFTFKHRTRDEFKDFMESLQLANVAPGEDPAEGRDDVELLLDIASGWDLDEPFDAESLGKLSQRYMGSAQAVVQAYFDELTGARTKN